MSKFFNENMENLLEDAAIQFKNIPIKKRPKITRIYEDDTWIIEIVDGNVRVACFEDWHYVDEITLSSDDFKNSTK